MKILYLFLISFSYAKGFPSELEENDLLSNQNLSPDIKSDHEDCDNVDKIQGELRKQKTVVKKMIATIQAEMTKMKECLLKSEENIAAESISACTAVLEQSIQEALDWANPQMEYHAGINDPGENQDLPYEMFGVLMHSLGESGLLVPVVHLIMTLSLFDHDF